MASLTVTIGGVDRTGVVKAGSVETEASINQVGRGTLTVESAAGYVPSLWDSLVVSLDGSPVWTGMVSEIAPEMALTTGGGVLTSTQVTAVDRMHLAHRVLRNGIVAGPVTLKALLQALVTDNLAAVGVSLAPGQATGPTLETQAFPWSTAAQVLEHLATVTGYVWRIDAASVLEMWAVGTKSSGVTFSAGNRNVMRCAWQRALNDYRNAQWVVYGEDGTATAYVEDAAEIAVRGLHVRAARVPTITDAAAAAEYAAALLAGSHTLVSSVRLETRTPGVDAGETCALSVPQLGLAADCLVERVRTRYRSVAGGVDATYELDLSVGTARGFDPWAWWQQLPAGGASGALGSPTGGVIGGTSLAAVEGDLGGSRAQGVQHSTWVPTREWRDWACPKDGTYTAHVECWTSHAGTSVQPRVWDATTSAQANIGTATTSTTPAKQTITFAAVAGREYRLELLPSNTAAEVYGLGKVRA